MPKKGQHLENTWKRCSSLIYRSWRQDFQRYLWPRERSFSSKAKQVAHAFIGLVDPKKVPMHELISGKCWRNFQGSNHSCDLHIECNFTFGLFPQGLECEKDPAEVASCRPISLLLIFSKVFEKSIIFKNLTTSSRKQSDSPALIWLFREPRYNRTSSQDYLWGKEYTARYV